MRPWRFEDKPSLTRHADNERVWRNLRDRFPHPYRGSDAEAWLSFAAAEPPPEGVWAIDVAGEAVGTISLRRGEDVERRSAELGFWLGEEFWGRGIMTEAVGRVTAVGLEQPDIYRISARVFSWNGASMRVLEKCGYAREAVLARSAIKDGVVVDQVLYGLTRPTGMPYVPATSPGGATIEDV